MHSQPDHIEILARALIIRDGSILCCKDLEHAYFYLPGGHVEPGETSPRAVKRELQEELGLCARVGGCRLIAEQIFEQGGRNRHEISLVFHVEHLSRAGRDCPGACAEGETEIEPGLEIRSTESHIGFEWIRIGDLAGADLRPGIIRDWIAGYRPGDPIGYLNGAKQ
jgi:8-oxo-dGTP pyrophosphatase MutT (NUDIX family)